MLHILVCIRTHNHETLSRSEGCMQSISHHSWLSCGYPSNQRYLLIACGEVNRVCNNVFWIRSWQNGHGTLDLIFDGVFIAREIGKDRHTPDNVHKLGRFSRRAHPGRIHSMYNHGSSRIWHLQAFSRQLYSHSIRGLVVQVFGPTETRDFDTGLVSEQHAIGRDDALQTDLRQPQFDRSAYDAFLHIFIVELHGIRQVCSRGRHGVGIKVVYRTRHGL
mmetsp:Transcript_122794/g.292092  ORF Transcript_122794/g.292092 Transcript_122794/m.292092 type:complete len:219 (-) Transcript_122794:1103-1759(-)